ncbi:MAG: type II secretion system protein GspK [Phycisphaerae bacterium]|nr:type II secretion system protein GspK [Phycisphaerae bacterium]
MTTLPRTEVSERRRELHRAFRQAGVRVRRGSVIVIVIWSIAIAAVLVAATQVVAFRQATMGRESIARVQARWAARAGIEEAIAILEYHTDKPTADDVMAVYSDLEAAADGELSTGSFSIRHCEDGIEKRGPQDENAKVNLTSIDRASLLNLDRMSFDVADSILDWRDADDEVQGLGAERDYYMNRNMPYEPRNGPFRSITELELVAGAWPEYVRGEDANLNGRLDPNENDGSASPPDDNADGLLNGGWSSFLTALTTGSRVAASGEEKLYLRDASVDEIKARVGVDDAQGKALQQYAVQPNARLETLLITDLATVASSSGGKASGNSAGAGGNSGGKKSGRSSSGSGGASGSKSAGAAGSANAVKALDTNQLRLLFAETTLDDPKKPSAGKTNINTASVEVIRRVLGIDSYAAEGIIALRSSKVGGITSIVDLLGASKITPQVLAGAASRMDVTSQVFTITSRGRSDATGLEVEITAVVDRSTLPARILEYREQ